MAGSLSAQRSLLAHHCMAGSPAPAAGRSPALPRPAAAPVRTCSRTALAWWEPQAEGMGGECTVLERPGRKRAASRAAFTSLVRLRTVAAARGTEAMHDRRGRQEGGAPGSPHAAADSTHAAGHASGHPPARRPAHLFFPGGSAGGSPARPASSFFSLEAANTASMRGTRRRSGQALSSQGTCMVRELSRHQRMSLHTCGRRQAVAGSGSGQDRQAARRCAAHARPAARTAAQAA